MKNENNPFGDVIYSYTRKQALADGVQIEVSKTAKEAGILFPTFLTRTVFDSFVAMPEAAAGQDENGRLWDIVWMLRFAIKKSGGSCERVPVEIYVSNDEHAPRLVKLLAVCGPLDIDDTRPAITVMMPDED